jgi:hypothetical protein
LTGEGDRHMINRTEQRKQMKQNQNQVIMVMK